MSIVRSITFGKTTKQHPCNTKHFRVYGGLNPDDMVLLQQGVLKNDAQPETLQLNIDVSDHLVRMLNSNDNGQAESVYTAFALSLHKGRAFDCSWILLQSQHLVFALLPQLLPT